MSDSNIQPVNDYILIEPEKLETIKKSGIVIPSTASEDKPQQGIVKAVGPGKKGKDGQPQAMSVKVGQKILYSKYGPTEIKLGDQEYSFIQDSDVIAVLN